MKPPFPQSFWLEPDTILCGEYPRHKNESDAQDKMIAILEAGCRVFIDLTEEGELFPYQKIAKTCARKLEIFEAELEFHRHPIVDVSIPKSPDEMRAVLRTIRSAKHRDLPVYLHCWGGVGRTGTVAACHLAEEFGMIGEEALEEYQGCWEACAKSTTRQSPETDEQRQYVRDWNADRPQREAQIRSAILGAATGDALGVPVEFQSRDTRKSDPVTGMREFGTHHQPAGTWSDDTSMIIATLAGIATAGDYDPESIMTEFENWANDAAHTPHGKVFDIGNATSQTIRTGEPGTGEYSNGNGSLMRILPIALLYGDDPELLEKACEISALTHAHDRSLYCCAFYCLVVSGLLHHDTIEEATAFAWEVMEGRWEFLPEERARFDGLHPAKLFARTEDQIGSSGHVIDTLEAALWVNAQHKNYADAVLHAVNLGDDTDTTGCVAGGLGGLIYGEAGIPEEWLETLAEKDMLLADLS